jgi:hypothetical protein
MRGPNDQVVPLPWMRYTLSKRTVATMPKSPGAYCTTQIEVFERLRHVSTIACEIAPSSNSGGARECEHDCKLFSAVVLSIGTYLTI